MGVIQEHEKLSLQTREEVEMFIMATLENYPEYLMDYSTIAPEKKALDTEKIQELLLLLGTTTATTTQEL